MRSRRARSGAIVGDAASEREATGKGEKAAARVSTGSRLRWRHFVDLSFEALQEKKKRDRKAHCVGGLRSSDQYG